MLKVEAGAGLSAELEKLKKSEEDARLHLKLIRLGFTKSIHSYTNLGFMEYTRMCCWLENSTGIYILAISLPLQFLALLKNREEF